MRVALDTAYASKPPPYTQINRAHPLAQQLVSLWVLGDDGNCPHDRVTGISATLSGTPASDVATPLGSAKQFSTGSYDFPQLDEYQIGFPASMAVLCTPPSLGGYTVPFATASNVQGFAISCRADLTFNSFCSTAGETWSYAISSGKIPATGLTMVAYSWPSLSTPSLYIGGQKTGISSSTLGNPPAYGAVGGSLGKWFAGSDDYNFQGGVLMMAALWNRALSDAEHMQLARQPFCMFNRRPMPVAA